MKIRFFQVDAFTNKPFKGNPAGVCLLDAPMNEQEMLAVAAENSVPETAFLFKDGDVYHLRWFSPAVERPLCGHGTLATAHVLWEHQLAAPDETLRFQTVSGELTAAKRGSRIELNFPARACNAIDLPSELKELFGDNYVNAVFSHDRYIVELHTAEQVIGFEPDLQLLRNYGCVITSRWNGAPYDFVSRYFALPVGVQEDPVTGSAHCSLATYWAERLHKTEFLAYQASARGGELRVILQGDRVLLQGEAVTVIEGTMHM
ncbi:MAG TPA: PhzF family phenazine biosynthesis protein [Chitinophaga sp.]|uniref:PhzF family phenazine biosynthesis protein n=1 Tax=Chitinophaga sp. TaxID=1869181 RepID=UPI002C9CFAFB|nr:PhzF family phenazine biosynthesis protein [Chitinophaga sp.]HVI45763.1 PhzF family phenazine biosynthesis protein [Chitinophaga sp.]